MATNKSGTDQSATPTKHRKESAHLTPQTFKAYVEWVHQQQEAALQYQRQCAEAYLELLHNLNEIAAVAQRPIGEAHQKLLDASWTANLDQESWLNYQQLQQELARVMMIIQPALLIEICRPTGI